MGSKTKRSAPAPEAPEVLETPSASETEAESFAKQKNRKKNRYGLSKTVTSRKSDGGVLGRGDNADIRQTIG